jgi:DEAD/DEAH box helicase domain-containing protein
LHDHQMGGAGFTARGYRRAEEWLRSALIRVESCSCDFGCPACVVSADCGRVNQSLDKATAVLLLRLLFRSSSTPNA